MPRYIYLFLALIPLLYLLYFALFYAYQRTFLFPRHLTPPLSDLPDAPGLEQLWLETSSGRVEAWYLAPLTEEGSPAPLMIIAHGNADLIQTWLQPVTGFREMGFTVLLVEYPGYGRSQGVPTHTSIRETFLLAYDTIIQHPGVDPQRIILFGHSIGGGAASILAAERPSRGLIFLSSFTTIGALATHRWMPSLAARDRFDNLAAVQGYPHPVLVIHGRADQTIPYVHGVALHGAAQQGELISLPCGHDECIEDWERFWRERASFFAKAGVITPQLP